MTTKRLAETELTAYLESLDLNNPKNINLYNMFNRLLLLSKNVFLELMELLISQTITTEELLALPDHQEVTVRAYIEKVRNNGVDVVRHMEAARLLLTGAQNYKEMFSDYVKAGSQSDTADFTHYVIFSNQLYGTISAYAPIDEFQTDKTKFPSYTAMETKYLSLVEKNVLLQEDRAAIAADPWLQRLPKVTQLVEACATSASWLVNTDKVNAIFSSKAILLSLLRGMADYGNYSMWDSYYHDVCYAAAKQAGDNNELTLDALWSVVSAPLPQPLEELQQQTLQLFFSSFLEWQLRYYYFPALSIFDSYRTTNLTTVKAEIDGVRSYLRLLQRYLQRIVSICYTDLIP